MQPVASELLKVLAGVLKRQRLRWYVFGAQAVVVHGFVRQTADVDVTVEVPLDDVPRLVAALERKGFALRVDKDVDEFIAATRVLPFVHRKTRLPVDIVIAGPGLEEQFLDRAVTVKAGAVSFPVIAVEDLLVLKILAGRAKDVEDVRGILKRNAKSNRKLVESRLRELEELLDQSDLLPRWREALLKI